MNYLNVIEVPWYLRTTYKTVQCQALNRFTNNGPPIQLPSFREEFSYVCAKMLNCWAFQFISSLEVSGLHRIRKQFE